MNHTTDEKLQKILARAGYGSRRAIETMISQGKVKVNGRTAQLGDRATEKDQIQVNDQAVKATRLAKQPTQVILYNKPEGRLCTRSDEKGRDTIFTQLPRIFNGRWISIGRLDLNTSGLLILTNNGELANRLAHPSFEVEREYLVRVFGEVPDSVINQLKAGIVLDDGPAKFEQISRFKSDDESMNNWFRVTIKEGRNREVRRMWESQGVQVSRLQRVRYGQFQLPRNLRKGKTEALTWKQVNQLLKSVDLPEEPRPDLRQNTAPDKKKFVKNSRSAQRALMGKKRTIHDLSKL
ncbi:23S rRNA pseudouridine(2605) synthase RluB [Thiomicrorhabdus sp.]|uniref:23S rRNA pseudouridine(2605) synthase RluB n=1 Tax=Thiomicrorhabdus sp. TaxID=2039724 RepID=UPI003564B3D9